MYRYVMGSGGGVSGPFNLLKASEEFQQTVDWVRYPTNSQTPTVNADSRPDPNGGTTADQVGLTANTSARLQQTVTLSASTEYTFSVYARAVSGTVDFRMRNVTLKAAEVKTATTTGGDGGGFTRFTYTFTTTTAGPYELALQNDSNATAKDVIFWGAMLNQGGTALDYEYAAPTTGGSAPAPAYAGFGDAYGGVTAYYSLRKFTEAETLNAIRVRRSSDDTEQDIGFDSNGDLDTTALLAFVGTGGTDNGYVTTWYDQAGSNDATNSTASEQPLIVDGGSVVTENGKAIIQRVDNSSTLKTSYAPNDGAATKTMIFVGDVSPTRGILIGSSTGSSDYVFFSQDGSSSTIVSNNATLSNEYLNGNSWVYADRNDVYDDLTSQGLVFANVQFSFVVNDMCLGYQADVTSNTRMMNYQELIIFDSDQSSNRTGIETNINDHFDIYTP